MSKLLVIDSHTAGEPTRVVVQGMPDLGNGDMSERCERMRATADWVRTSLTLEPRGAPWIVGAALLEPCDASCVAGVIFFNNVGYLGMCGHGAIGVIATLAHLGKVDPGIHRLETPAGQVSTELHADGSVSVENVLSYRYAKGVEVSVPSFGPVVGDIAFGGNWFFLTEFADMLETPIDTLTGFATRIKSALADARITGERGQVIDHIELVGPPSHESRAHARSFVLCPGNQYDRSPCGTGTSAKLACLAADGTLKPGEPWVQESIKGSTFRGTYQTVPGGVLPTITGRAFVVGTSETLHHPEDPLRYGWRGTY